MVQFWIKFLCTIVPIFLGCFSYKIAINFFAGLKLRRYKEQYLQYLKDNCNDEEKRQNWTVVESKSDIIRLFKRAGLHSFTMQIMQPAGYNYASAQQLDLFDNLASITQIGQTNIPNTIVNYFHQAIGIYKTRMRDALSIFFWIDAIVFLPKSIAKYLGCSIQEVKINFWIKILQLIYWALMISLIVFTPHYTSLTFNF